MGLYPTALSKLRNRLRKALSPRDGRRLRRKRADSGFSNSAAVVQTLEQRILPTTVWVASVQDGEEGGQAGSFTLQRDNTEGSLSVSYAIDASSTAQANDYSGPAGSIMFAPGQATAVINFNIIDDQLIESTESLKINLTPPPPMMGNYTIGAQSSGAINIFDNDAPPNQPPVLLNFAYTTPDGAVYTFTGQVNDEGAAACIIVFGGLLDGHQCNVELNGSFSYTVTLGGSASGFVFAHAVDSLNQTSPDAYVLI